MKKLWSLIILAVLLVVAQSAIFAAQKAESEKDSKSEEKPATEAAPPKEESSVTDHSIRLAGQTVPYKATAATVLLKDEKDQPTASMFYVAYTRSDVKDLSRRPLAFLYNGGPGSSAVWLHMGAFGPRRVVTENAKPTPPPPYRLEDNSNCLLDKADLVFIDPVGTGFSRAVGKAKDKDFWGVDSDVKSIAQFIDLYVTRNNRWNSPKFLIGESYGTFRSAALSNYLQSHDGMDLNGIVLVSSVLNLGTLSFHPGEDMTYIFYLPSYAATAWFHNALAERPADLDAFLAKARQFAATEYAEALMKGAKLAGQEKADVLKKLSAFTGLSQDYLTKANLRVNLPQFMEELQRSSGRTTGRLDARFSGPTFDLLGEYAEYDPQEPAVVGAFTAVFNDYVRQELKFGGDKHYVILSDQAGRNWDWKRQGEGLSDLGFPGAPNVISDLAQALISNVHLRVEVENGIYDLATPFYATEYTMDHLGLPADIAGHVSLKYYKAGHMMYLNDESLTELKTSVGQFIESAARQ
jgi:carboxypeptidase C (cathepsin A)